MPSIILTEAQHDGLDALQHGFICPTNTARSLLKRGLIDDRWNLTINGWRQWAAERADGFEPLDPDARDWPSMGTVRGDFMAAARMARWCITGHNRAMRRTQRINAIETSHDLPL